MDWISLVAILFASQTILECSAANILLLPLPMKSHIGYFTALGAALVQHKHEVYMVLYGDVPPPKDVVNAGINVITYRTPNNWSKTVDNAYDLFHSHTIKDPTDFQTAFSYLKPITKLQCEYAVTDTKMVDTISKMEFDLAINDGLFLAHCLLLISVHLNIPYISMSTAYFPWFLNIPALPSFVPSLFVLTDKMTIADRIMNIFGYAMGHLITTSQTMLTGKVLEQYSHILHIPVSVYSRNSLLWLLNSNPIIDHPKPLMPHVIQIGGIGVKEPDSLPNKLQVFFDEAKHGVIVVSFGSLGAELPEFVNQRLVATFTRLQQRVVWRFENRKGVPLPDNVLIMNWLPQRDVLAHPNTVLFITHCGNNGQFEALYTGVPMVGLPLHGDQSYNCKRIEKKGYGMCLSVETFSADALLTAITNIVQNDKIRQNVKRASKMLNDPPETPGDRAVYWIEHVIKYGGDHLRSHSIELPWYQYLMLDILAFIFVVVCLFCTIIYQVLISLCKYYTPNPMKDNL